MTGLWTALSLFAVAFVLSRAARRLAEARWPLRAPALGVVAWQSLTASLVLSLGLGSIALLMPELSAVRSLTELAHLCTTVLVEQWQDPADRLLTGLGLAVIVALGARLVWTLTRGCVSAWTRRRRHRASLDLTGRPRPDGVTVVEHPVPVVYCLPGRPGRIVATTAATQLLSSAQLDGVLAHERAHLRFRHHLALTWAEALARTFWFLGTFDLAAAQVERFVEMQADDAAGRHARPHLAVAMLRLARGPAESLSAGGATLDRARRLLGPEASLPTWRRGAVAVTAVAALVAPVALGLVGAAGPTPHCCSAAGEPSDPWYTDLHR